jgi:hypothetical protein
MEAEDFQGSELDVHKQILDAYPWLFDYPHETVEDLLHSLNRFQSYIVQVLEW